MKLGKVIEFLNLKSTEEDTATLRKFTEQQFKHADELYVQFKRETLKKQDDLDDMDKLLRLYAERIDGDLADFKNFLYGFHDDKLVERTFDATEMEILHDSDLGKPKINSEMYQLPELTLRRMRG